MHEMIELLKQIAEQTKPNNQTIWVAAISSASAIIGASIGAIILYKSTKNQITATTIIEEKKLKANIVTTERLRWLQELRSKTRRTFQGRPLLVF